MNLLELFKVLVLEIVTEKYFLIQSFAHLCYFFILELCGLSSRSSWPRMKTTATPS